MTDIDEELDEEQRAKLPWSYRDVVRGIFKFVFPWFGGPVEIEWPASGRQAMITMCVVVPMVCLTAMTCCYIIFVGAVPENISRFGQMVTRSIANKPEPYRAPEQVPVKTNDGIEIIEVCPPVNCDQDCPCAECPPPVPCPICPVCEPSPTKETAGIPEWKAAPPLLMTR